MSFRIARLVGEGIAPTPTFHDLGLQWAFASYLRYVAATLAQTADSVERALHEIDERRREGEAR